MFPYIKNNPTITVNYCKMEKWGFTLQNKLLVAFSTGYVFETNLI